MKVRKIAGKNYTPYKVTEKFDVIGKKDVLQENNTS